MNQRDPLTEKVVNLLAQIVDRFIIDAERSAETLGLTMVQAKVLAQLERPTPMHRIAGLLRTERSNVTGVVDRLEARGLVIRVQDDTDRRIKNIVATEEGRRLAHLYGAGLRFSVDPLVALSVGEREALRDLLRLMLQAPADPAGEDASARKG